MGGKGDLIKVIPRSRYEAAVDRFHRRSELPPMTDGDEDEPTRGVVRGGKDGMRKHMQGGRDAATKAVAQAEQPYGSAMDKCVILATMSEIETPAMQAKIEEALPEVLYPEYSYLFQDQDGNRVPMLGVKMVHGTGRGDDADYSGDLSDPKTRAVYDGRVVGGDQTGGSGKRGATRVVQIGSAEDDRVTEAAGTTVIQCTMALRLDDAITLVTRRSGHPRSLSLCKAHAIRGCVVLG